MFGLFSSKSSSSSSSDTTNTDNKNQVTDGGQAVSGTNNVLNATTPEAWEFAFSSLSKALDTTGEILKSADEATGKIVGSVSDNARETMNFVQERSTTDLVQMTKDLAPWIIGGVFLLNIGKILNGLKGLFK